MDCYDKVGRRCSNGEQAGTRVLADGITELFPPAGDQSAYGIYNCRGNSSGSGQLSVHGEGRAIDVGYNPPPAGGHPTALALCDWLVENSVGLGVQLIVYYGRSWHCERGWGSGSGHIDHVHVEQNWAAAKDPDRIRAYLEGDMPLNDADKAWINEAVKNLLDSYTEVIVGRVLASVGDASADELEARLTPSEPPSAMLTRFLYAVRRGVKDEISQVDKVTGKPNTLFSAMRAKVDRITTKVGA